MNISEVACLTELPAKTLRYYEIINLVVPARKTNGYRDYDKGDLEQLRLISRTRQLGFSIEGCRSLLRLFQDKKRASADIKQIASSHLCSIDRKIEQLKLLRNDLGVLVEACAGNQDAACAILDDLVQPRKEG